MILKRITMKNFLSHKDTKIDFPPGVTVFIGPNGAGKTSIIDAIFVALFNTPPRGDKFDDIIYRGEREAKIELEFEEGGIPYKIVWRRKKGRSSPTYELYRLDRNMLIAHGVKAVKKEVENIIGIEKDSAVNSILIRQGEITSLLDQAPAKRKEIIGKLLGLDRLETAWKTMNEVINYFKEELREYEEYEFEYSYKTKELQQKTEELQRLSREIETLKKQIVTLEEKLENMQQIKDSLENKKKRYEELTKDIAILQVKIKQTKEKVEKLKSELAEAEKAKELAEKLESEVKKLSLLEQLKDILAKLDSLNQQKEALERELDKINRLEQEIRDTEDKYRQYVEIEEKIKEIENEVSILQPKRQDKVQIEETIKRVEDQIKALNEEFQQVLTELNKYKIELSAIPKEYEAKTPAEIDSEIAGENAKIEQLKKEIERQIRELEKAKSAKEEAEKLKPLVDLLEKLKQLWEIRSKIDSLSKDLEHLNRILQDINEKKSELEKSRDGYEEYLLLEKEIESLEKQKSELLSYRSEVQKLQAMIDEKKKQLQILQGDANKLEAEIKMYLNEITPEAKQQKITEIQQQIKQLKGELLQKRNKIAEFKSRIKEIEEYLNILGDANECPVCHQKLTPEHRQKVKDEFSAEKAEKEKMIQQLESETLTLEEEIEKLEDLLITIEKLDVKRYLEYQKKIQEISTELKKLEEKLSQAEEKVNMLKHLEEVLLQKLQRKKEVEPDYWGYLSAEEELKSLLKKYPEEKIKEQYKGIEEELAEYHQKESALIEAIGQLPENLESEIKALEEKKEQFIQLKTKAQRIPIIEDDISKLKQEIHEIETWKIPMLLAIKKLLLEKALRELNEDISRLNEKLKLILKDIEHLEELESQLQELKNQLETLKEDYQRYIAASNALKQERSKSLVLEELEEIHQKILDLTKEEEALVSNIGQLPENIEGEIKRLKQVKEAYIRATEKSKDIDSIKEELKKEELELESLMKEIDSKNKELKDLAYSQEEFEKIQKEVQNLSAEVNRLKGTLSEKIQQKEKLETEIKELLHNITELEKQLQKIEKIQKFIEDLERIRGAYHKDGVQKLLRKKIAPVISELATNYIESFNMDITDIYLSEDFDISVTKNSVEVPISLLSGGEKVAVALSLRLAIARVLARRLSVVIMDEPTTHLDEERRRDLVEILGKFFKAENTIPQIIIVTHHRELENVADTVYLVQKVDGVSKVVESFPL